jgi:uncharacterized protein YqgC (DUF456 family)
MNPLLLAAAVDVAAGTAANAATAAAPPAAWLAWLGIGIAVGLTAWSAVAVLIQFMGLPGTWLILLAAVAVRAFEMVVPLGPEPMFSWTTLLLLAGLALLAEAVEFIASALGAKGGGATKAGMTGALVGGLIGVIAGTFLIPIPVVGSVAGAVVGSGAGAVVGELSEGGRTLASTAKPAAGAAVGRILGTLAKTGFAALMWGIVTIAAFA